MPPWFEARPFPWQDPRAKRLHELLLNAYPEIHLIRTLAKHAGINLSQWVKDQGSGHAWESLLDCASRQGTTHKLLTQALGDNTVRAYHAPLRELMSASAPPSPRPSGPTISAPQTVPFQDSNSSSARPAAPASPRASAPVAFSNPTGSPGATTSRATAPAPRPARKEEVLFSWIHISDIHVGQGNAGRGWDQDLVLDALVRDVEKIVRERKVPTPTAIFVTGDIAFSGKPDQYARAANWLDRLSAAANLDRSHIHVVPGNHDVDREADKALATSRLLYFLREAIHDIDVILGDDVERGVLASRMNAYLEFASTFGFHARSDLFWSLPLPLPPAAGAPTSTPSKSPAPTPAKATHTPVLPIRILGLNTALLAADKDDKGKLRLGNQQTALLKDTRDTELTLVLTHHPFTGGWLRDESTARGWLQQRADIHLCGHVHEPEAEQHRTSGGTGIVTVTAGAVHGDKQPEGVPESHGYNFAAVVHKLDGTFALRVWPRAWSKRKDFRLDTHQVPEGQLFAEHPLPRLRPALLTHEIG
ncbi:MAG: metallophosphoesterase [Polyangiaceae bacterium]